MKMIRKVYTTKEEFEAQNKELETKLRYEEDISSLNKELIIKNKKFNKKFTYSKVFLL